MRKTLTLILSLLLMSAPAAQAHHIWIELQAGQNAIIRFGEFGENLRETSPGLLDKFGKPRATLISARGEQAVDANKTSNGFLLPFTAGNGDAIIAEDAAYPLYSFKQAGKDMTGWYHPAARLITGFAAQQPRLTLDLVPTGTPGEFKLFFKGKPMPKIKVSLTVQSGWAKEEHTDEQGVVKFDMPWKGIYVAEVSHTDRTAGTRQGLTGPEPYQSVSYVISLTYVKPEGLEQLPAGPAATPGK